MRHQEEVEDGEMGLSKKKRERKRERQRDRETERESERE